MLTSLAIFNSSSTSMMCLQIKTHLNSLIFILSSINIHMKFSGLETSEIKTTITILCIELNQVEASKNYPLWE